MGFADGKLGRTVCRVTPGVVAFALAVWLAYSIYLRLTLDPPGYGLPTDDTPVPEDVSTQLRRLRECAEYFGESRNYTLPPPPTGMRWNDRSAWSPGSVGGTKQHELVLEDVDGGDWTPETRPNLRAAIAFLDTEASRRAIQTIQTTTAEDWALPLEDKRVGYLVHTRVIIRSLVSDARHQLETHHDPTAAWADLRAILDLADRLAGGSMIDQLSRAASVSLTLDEIRYSIPVWPAELLREIEQRLRHTPTHRESWSGYVETERRILADLIDLSFTRLPNGNGWYVLTTSDLAHERFDAPLRATTMPARRSRLWDLTSFLYNDRRTVEQKAARYLEMLESLMQLPYPQGLRVFQAANASGPVFGMLDGYPLTEFDPDRLLSAYQIGLFSDAQCAATRAMIALELYHRATGDYPEALAALVPAYLPALPDDPFADRALSYQRDSATAYALWSWGVDGEDDSGRAEENHRHRSADGDQYFDWPRMPACFEPELESVDAN